MGANNIGSPGTDFIYHVKSSVVSLVEQTDTGQYVPYCGGVWVNKEYFLTAKHCVTDENDNVEIGKVFSYQIYSEFENHYPLSDNKKVYLAKVIAEGDDNVDLAILQSIDDVPHHVATVANYNPPDGLTVHIVGHPHYLQWGYMQGTISATRILNNTEQDRLFLNIVGFVWMGNSGGGAFDSDGNLLGIASLKVNAPGQSMFVHTKELIKILKENKILYYTN